MERMEHLTDLDQIPTKETMDIKRATFKSIARLGELEEQWAHALQPNCARPADAAAQFKLLSAGINPVTGRKKLILFMNAISKNESDIKVAISSAIFGDKDAPFNMPAETTALIYLACNTSTAKVATWRADKKGDLMERCDLSHMAYVSPIFRQCDAKRDVHPMGTHYQVSAMLPAFVKTPSVVTTFISAFVEALTDALKNHDCVIVAGVEGTRLGPQIALAGLAASRLVFQKEGTPDLNELISEFRNCTADLEAIANTTQSPDVDAEIDPVFTWCTTRPYAKALLAELDRVLVTIPMYNGNPKRARLLIGIADYMMQLKTQLAIGVTTAPKPARIEDATPDDIDASVMADTSVGSANTVRLPTPVKVPALLGAGLEEVTDGAHRPRPTFSKALAVSKATTTAAATAPPPPPPRIAVPAHAVAPKPSTPSLGPSKASSVVPAKPKPVAQKITALPTDVGMAPIHSQALRRFNEKRVLSAFSAKPSADALGDTRQALRICMESNVVADADTQSARTQNSLVALAHTVCVAAAKSTMGVTTDFPPGIADTLNLDEAEAVLRAGENIGTAFATHLVSTEIQREVQDLSTACSAVTQKLVRFREDLYSNKASGPKENPFVVWNDLASGIAGITGITATPVATNTRPLDAMMQMVTFSKAAALKADYKNGAILMFAIAGATASISTQPGARATTLGVGVVDPLQAQYDIIKEEVNSVASTIQPVVEAVVRAICDLRMEDVPIKDLSSVLTTMLSSHKGKPARAPTTALTGVPTKAVIASKRGRQRPRSEATDIYGACVTFLPVAQKLVQPIAEFLASDGGKYATVLANLLTPDWDPATLSASDIAKYVALCTSSRRIADTTILGSAKETASRLSDSVGKASSTLLDMLSITVSRLVATAIMPAVNSLAKSTMTMVMNKTIDKHDLVRAFLVHMSTSGACDSACRTILKSAVKKYKSNTTKDGNKRSLFSGCLSNVDTGTPAAVAVYVFFAAAATQFGVVLKETNPGTINDDDIAALDTFAAAALSLYNTSPTPFAFTRTNPGYEEWARVAGELQSALVAAIASAGIAEDSKDLEEPEDARPGVEDHVSDASDGEEENIYLSDDEGLYGRAQKQRRVMAETPEAPGSPW